jgi:hypothetical protein
MKLFRIRIGGSKRDRYYLIEENISRDQLDEVITEINKILEEHELYDGLVVDVCSDFGFTVISDDSLMLSDDLYVVHSNDGSVNVCRIY